MTIKKLISSDLVPNTDQYRELFKRLNIKNKFKLELYNIQPRLYCAFKQLLNSRVSSTYLLIKAPEEIEYLNILSEGIRSLQSKKFKLPILCGGKYNIKNNKVTFKSIPNKDSNFTTVRNSTISIDWTESEQLFGCVRKFNNKISLQSGLIHKANGGVLVIMLRTILNQPILWLRLKSIVNKQIFDWVSFHEFYPLPLNIPSMPLSVKIVIIGNRKSLADFQKIEPELTQNAFYSEFEDNIYANNIKNMIKWCNWVIYIAYKGNFSFPTPDAWPILIREAVRYTGDQRILPLCPIWITKQFNEVTLISNSKYYSGNQLTKTLKKREWREKFLIKRTYDDILFNHILIETDGKRIGQINSLSIVEFPGYPHIFGEPSRISCVVYIGDSEFNDIESKTELGGNIHKKGMMIIQAFLMSELKLEQPIPFSSSITFEQSYNEIDGDSASIASLCALISALANVGINQNIAITGSVDQFGKVQPVSNLNEKIEGFFNICQRRGLNGNHGVIIPASNVFHISLCQELINAVEEKKFFIWTIENIKDALLLLTNISWNDNNNDITLIKIIKERIKYAIKQEVKYKSKKRNVYSRMLNFLNWIK